MRSHFEWGPVEGRGGGSDIIDKPKFCFFNYLLPSPQLSLASQAILVAARAVPVPQREGDIGGFIAIHRKPHTVLRRLTGHPKKMAEPFLVVS